MLGWVSNQRLFHTENYLYPAENCSGSPYNFRGIEIIYLEKHNEEFGSVLGGRSGTWSEGSIEGKLEN